MVARRRSPVDASLSIARSYPTTRATIKIVPTVYSRLQLMAFTRTLNQEEQRHISEQLSEEELAMFDLLTRPNTALTKQEIAEVKKVAQTLLETLKKEKLVLDWRKKQQAKADVQVTIEKILDRLPPS